MEQAEELIDNQDADPVDVRRALTELTGALRDVLRVATNRGRLLAASEAQTWHQRGNDLHSPSTDHLLR